MRGPTRPFGGEHPAAEHHRILRSGARCVMHRSMCAERAAERGGQTRYAVAPRAWNGRYAAP
jgi:hypothetical protein